MQPGRGTAVLLLALELAAEATGLKQIDSGYRTHNTTGEEARNQNDPEMDCEPSCEARIQHDGPNLRPYFAGFAMFVLCLLVLYLWRKRSNILRRARVGNRSLGVEGAEDPYFVAVRGVRDTAGEVNFTVEEDGVEKCDQLGYDAYIIEPDDSVRLGQRVKLLLHREGEELEGVGEASQMHLDGASDSARSIKATRN